jgi:hypothetical protein
MACRQTFSVACAATSGLKVVVEMLVTVDRRRLPMLNDLRHDWRDWSQAERAAVAALVLGLGLVLAAFVAV